MYVVTLAAVVFQTSTDPSAFAAAVIVSPLTRLTFENVARLVEARFTTDATVTEPVPAVEYWTVKPLL